jgi:hypothetical protein
MHDIAGPLQQADSVEVAFGPAELLYSRTDKRGVIKAGNSVFQRVCGFAWDALMGAPHRIVRHPDTPKAVFSILWQAIQRDEPVAAYVKNKSVSGGFYWVLATVLPFADGYLSIRIKPTSRLFDSVRQEYEALLAQEFSEALSADLSAARLRERLQALGFADDQAFMMRALLQECSGRDRFIKNPNGPMLAEIEKMLLCLSSLTEEQKVLLQEFDRLRDLPTNMRIIASRLEPSGGPVSAISENYKVTSTELSSAIKAFAMGDTSLLKQMVASFQQAVILILCARLQAEVLQHFNETGTTCARMDPAAEARTLAELSRSFDARASAALSKAEELARALAGDSSNMRRAILGLDSIRVMGRVESGRLGAAGAHLAATIDQLDLRHSTIIKRLESILELSTTIDAGVRRIGMHYQPRSLGPNNLRG